MCAGVCATRPVAAPRTTLSENSHSRGRDLLRSGGSTTPLLQTNRGPPRWFCSPDMYWGLSLGFAGSVVVSGGVGVLLGVRRHPWSRKATHASEAACRVRQERTLDLEVRAPRREEGCASVSTSVNEELNVPTNRRAVPQQEHANCDFRRYVVAESHSSFVVWEYWHNTSSTWMRAVLYGSHRRQLDCRHDHPSALPSVHRLIQ